MDAERDWVAALGDPASRDDLAGELRARLRAALARAFGHQLADADLDDLAQDSVARVLGMLGRFRGESRFLTWATAVAIRVALGELRKRKHAARAMEQVVAEGKAAVDVALAPRVLQQADVRTVLRQAIDDALTPVQREALLARLGGLELMEIARRTGRSRGALYKLLHDARKRLRAHLEHAGLSPSDLLDEGSAA